MAPRTRAPRLALWLGRMMSSRTPTAAAISATHGSSWSVPSQCCRNASSAAVTTTAPTASVSSPSRMTLTVSRASRRARIRFIDRTRVPGQTWRSARICSSTAGSMPYLPSSARSRAQVGSGFIRPIFHDLLRPPLRIGDARSDEGRRDLLLGRRVHGDQRGRRGGRRAGAGGHVGDAVDDRDDLFQHRRVDAVLAQLCAQPRPGRIDLIRPIFHDLLRPPFRVADTCGDERRRDLLLGRRVDVKLRGDAGGGHGTGDRGRRRRRRVTGR